MAIKKKPVVLDSRVNRKQPIELTREVKDFILQCMHEGLDVSQICKKYPTKVPARETIYRASMKDKEFAEEINSAYSVLLMIRLDALNELSSKTASEAYTGIDWREAEATLKRQIDALKFVLGKMAPILSARFNKIEKVEVTNNGQIDHRVVVMSYATPDVITSSSVLIDQ